MKKAFLGLALIILLITPAGCRKEKSSSSSNQISSKAVSSHREPGEISSAEAVSSAASAEPVQSAASVVQPVQSKALTSSAVEMHVGCSGITGGVLADKYGKFGSQLTDGIPTLSMPLTISNPPPGTAAFAIIMEDLSTSPNFVHWLAANITSPSIPENASITMKNSMVQGKNDFGKIGYGGPTPPKSTHKYSIKIYALSASLSLTEGYSRADLTAQLSGKILVQKEITGTYRHK